MFKKIWRAEGFTLIELLAVMAIVAVLAAIIAVAVAGSGETSRDTQTVQDGTTIETSAADFFGNQTGSDLVETRTHITNQIHPFSGGVTGAEATSTVWPEEFITTTYAIEFPSGGLDDIIDTVTIIEEDGTTITVKTLLEGFTAIDFTELETANVLTNTPESVDAVGTVDLGTNGNVNFHDFLWLFEIDEAAGSTGVVSSRNVVIYKLLSVEDISGSDKVNLIFLRIF